MSHNNIGIVPAGAEFPHNPETPLMEEMRKASLRICEHCESLVIIVTVKHPNHNSYRKMHIVNGNVFAAIESAREFITDSTQ
jgi:hypothetical protein